MIDWENKYGSGPWITRRIVPNWDYKQDILRKTREDVYLYQIYSRYRPELFDWEKFTDGKAEIKLKSLNGKLALDFKECAARTKHLLEVKPKLAELMQ